MVGGGGGGGGRRGEKGVVNKSAFIVLSFGSKTLMAAVVIFSMSYNKYLFHLLYKERERSGGGGMMGREGGRKRERETQRERERES